jgi:thiol-disulfide isomerase/thioredoxin
MTKASAKPALLDILAGVVAIVVVVGASIASSAIGFDFRGIFGLTAAGFFLAGLARGKNPIGRLGWQVIRVSAGGLLGNAALLLNNGPHLASIQAGLLLTALAFSCAGLLVRRNRRLAPRFSASLAVLAVIAAALIVLVAVPGLSTYSAFETTDRPLPSFTLLAGNQTIHSEDLKGHVVILAFWASWCLQCVEELPELQKAYMRYQNDPEIVFLAVDTGWANETPAMGKRRLAQHHIEIPFAFDSGAAAESLGVDAIPALILIDRKGHVRLVHRGYDWSEHLGQELDRQIERLRRETGPG